MCFVSLTKITGTPTDFDWLLSLALLAGCTLLFDIILKRLFQVINRINYILPAKFFIQYYFQIVVCCLLYSDISELVSLTLQSLISHSDFKVKPG